MNGPFGKKFSLQPLQLQANEHGLLLLNVKRRPARPPVELPPNATRTQAVRAWLDRVIDCLLGD